MYQKNIILCTNNQNYIDKLLLISTFPFTMNSIFTYMFTHTHTDKLNLCTNNHVMENVFTEQHKTPHC